jgi:hypothetical protein
MTEVAHEPVESARVPVRLRAEITAMIVLQLAWLIGLGWLAWWLLSVA